MLKRTCLKPLVIFLTAFALVACGPGPDPNAVVDPANPEKETETTQTEKETTQPEKETPKGLAIHTIDPQEGRTAGGELVVLHGEGFVDGTEVFFGSLKSPEITVYSSVVIHVRTPAHKPGFVDVKVKTPKGEVVVEQDAFIFRDSLKITALEPAAGPHTGGTPITVRGVGFSANTKLLIGGRLALDITVVDNETVHAITPQGTHGPATVIVATGLTSAELYHGFRFTKAPQITGISPLSAHVGSQVHVTLSGAGLTANAEVLVNGEPTAIVKSTGDTSLSIALQGAQAGSVDIEVLTGDGEAIVPNAFTFTEPSDDHAVQLVNAWPRAGDVGGGDEVVLVAYGLTTLADTTVRFGPAEAQIVSVDLISNRVTVLTPAQAASQVHITIQNNGGSSSLDNFFKFTTQPELSSASPNSGFVNGGSQLVVTGNNLHDADLFVGALPATILQQSATQITAVTPLGSPGTVDIRAVSAGGEAVLEASYTYKPMNGPELYAMTPSYGAIAGGTLVKIYGGGFATGAVVRFAKQQVVGAQLHSSSEIHVRAPKADEPTVVDVTVEQGTWKRTLVDAYAFFDPTAPYGGSWGGPIRGTINVTVLDIYTTDPVPEAFVIMWADPTTPYQGWTDDRGQIVFSGPGIDGPQMITASKNQFTTMSVVEYDAENVNVHLIPINPPSPGGGGGGPTILPPGQVTGKVKGLGKYITMPAQSCSELATKGLVGTAGTTNCEPCQTDAACGPNSQCIDVAGEGTHCAASCLADSDCPQFYMCAGVAGEDSNVCLPHPGVRAAYCQTTNHRLWEMPPEPDYPLDKSWVNANGEFKMHVRLGELAIICIGGVQRVPGDVTSFVPTVMGVRRHVEPISAENLPDQDVELTIPLTKDVPIRLDGAPLVFTDPVTGTQPTTARLDVAWDFGADGYWWPEQLTAVGTDAFTLKKQPKSFTDDLDGVTYTFMAVITGGQYAQTGTQDYKVKVLEVDRVFSFIDGVWTAQKAGIPDDILGLWGTDPANVWGVGQDGLIAHGKNGSWFPQASPTSEHLRAVWGSGENFAVAVGDNGAALSFDGAKWTVEDTGTTAPLYAVWGSSPDNLFAVGQNIALHRTQSGWAPLYGTAGSLTPLTNLRAAWGPSPTELWAVGDDGKLYKNVAGLWSSETITSGKALRGMAAGPDSVWIVGDAGSVFEYKSPGDVEQHDVPTTEALNDVHATGDGSLFVVGDRGLLMRFDGNGWAAEQAPDYGGDLMAVLGFDGQSMAAFAAGTQVVSLGPILSFPIIGAPLPITQGGTSFGYKADWSHAPSAEPTLQLVEMVATSPGGEFPLWWTVVDAKTTEIQFPDLLAIKNINPWVVPGQIFFRVNRILKPGTTVHNFDFWDFYDASEWKSWSRNGVFFQP